MGKRRYIGAFCAMLLVVSACSLITHPRLENPYVYWTMDAETFMTVRQVEHVLTYRLGWQKAGLEFVYTEERSEADIDIRFLDVFSCGGDTPACAFGTVSLDPDGPKPGCFIFMYGVGVRPADTIRKKASLNHEVGHCLHLKGHFGDGVMAPAFLGTKWPKDYEINTVRFFFEGRPAAP